ncbi:minor tail protein [Microcystis phage vB_MweS-yong2]|nr:minor tail protein [Microcystis phage vB_MweS-yong2]
MSVTVATEIRSAQAEAALIAAAGPRANVGIARALNRAGQPTRNAYLRRVRDVLGLKPWRYGKRQLGDVLKSRTSTRRANAARLEYSLAGFGAGLPAAYYQPREAPAGASIVMLGSRQTIARSFYLGGRFPRRVRSRISHTVWRRAGKGKWALARPRGPGVPEGMTQPQAASLWRAQAQARLRPALLRELTAIIRGHA